MTLQAEKVAVRAPKSSRASLAGEEPDIVDVLARKTSRELDVLFRGDSVVPADFAAVSGHPRGRVLALPGLDGGVLGGLVRMFQASVLFPWEGKSFAAQGEREGRGVNRFRYPLRRGWFTFRTGLASSLVDARPCIAIDYDVPENARVARVIYDELRALGDGVFLGRGMRRAGGGVKLVLWFCVDTRAHDADLR